MSAEEKQNSTPPIDKTNEDGEQQTAERQSDDHETVGNGKNSPPSSGLSSKSGKKKLSLEDDNTDYEFVEEEDSDSSEVSSDADKRKPLFLFYTREIAKSFGREQFLIVSMRETIVYFIFMITLFVVTSGYATASMFRYKHAMESMLTKSMYKQDLTHDKRQTITDFNKMNTIEDALSFIEYAPYAIFYYEGDEKGTERRQWNNAMQENRMLGHLRLRQVRVRNDSCEIHADFRVMFQDCYGPYSRSTDETRPYGLATGTAWTYSSSVELGAYAYVGEFATYRGGGYYVDFSGDAEEINSTLKELVENIWIDKATRAVFLDFTTYNANDNLFCSIKLVMEFPPSGGVVPAARFHVQKLFRYHTSFDYFIMVNEIIFFVFCAYYLCEELYEMKYFKWDYARSFWNWVDLVLVVLLFITLSIDVFEDIKVTVNLPDLITKSDRFPNFERLYYKLTLYNGLRAVEIGLAWLKLTKYLTTFNTMYQLQETISKASTDVAYYSVIFITVFLTFACLGQLLFGGSVESFRTLTHSFFTLLCSVVGNFNYREIENEGYFLPSVYFTSFIFVILFILINMYTAILVDVYADVRTRHVFEADTREIQMSLGDLLNKWLIVTLRKLKMGRLAEHQEKRMKLSKAKARYDYIHNLLHRCGYSELDIDIYFQKYGISEEKEISEEDMKLFLKGIGSSVIRGPHTAEGMLIHEYQNLYDNMNERVNCLEDAVILANNKVTIIITKLDAIHQIQMARMSEH